jgi:hypothetical protein
MSVYSKRVHLSNIVCSALANTSISESRDPLDRKLDIIILSTEGCVGMLSMFFVCHRGMPSAVFYVSNLLTT